MLAFSRTRNSSQALADMARAAGLRAETPDDAEVVVRAARILVNSVPLAPGVTPFLGPRWLAPGSFVRAIDLARSWYPEHLRKIDVLATDDHDQQAALPPL